MRYLVPVLLGFGACALLVVTLSTAPAKGEETETKTDSPNLAGEGEPYYPAVKIPEMLEFAGESVPLQDFEVRERLDREMLVNSYWHSQTLQNLKMASRWFPVIETILARNGVPEDFKYLAVAESNLRNVVSPARATGVWQIMKNTGTHYGLTINSEVDERYDVEKATEAACKYLKAAHKRYDQDWTLAAAAYNMGEPNLDKRLASQKSDNYYDLYLNSETSRYVFRILAFKLIYESHEQYGFILDEEDKYAPLDYYVIEVSKSIPDLASFAKEYGTTYKMLKVLNPWLRSSKLTVSAPKTYELKLPKDARRASDSE